MGQIEEETTKESVRLGFCSNGLVTRSSFEFILSRHGGVQVGCLRAAQTQRTPSVSRNVPDSTQRSRRKKMMASTI
ncbi:hypothetical protein OUZ56_011508 [Daphnia magna]|uniref:Uncharacterized protein n=1 Tax=Daphnia magna TaxID=35525 RepID=A0ABQ9Z0K6_9CRUS|nr:hypothetical protein OUZ56_011508 [Daphnia magna]